MKDDTHDHDTSTGAVALPAGRSHRRRAPKTPAANQSAARAPRPARPVRQALPLGFLLEEYARDLRRGEMASKTIRNYLGVLALALIPIRYVRAVFSARLR